MIILSMVDSLECCSCGVYNLRVVVNGPVAQPVRAQS